MLKTVAKMFLGFLLMLIISAGSAYVSYLVTSNVIKGRNETEIKNVSAKRTEEKIKTVVPDKEETTVTLYDYYLVRLEGELLGVYAVSDGHEEFLYNESVYVSDLSEDDLNLLGKGVILQSPSELTGFIEDFTS